MKILRFIFIIFICAAAPYTLLVLLIGADALINWISIITIILALPLIWLNGWYEDKMKKNAEECVWSVEKRREEIKDIESDSRLRLTIILCTVVAVVLFTAVFRIAGLFNS